MSAVTFTKNLSPENRSAGISLLGTWWRASPLSQQTNFKMATSFDGLVLYWDKNYPTAIEWLGEQLKTYSISDMNEVMKDAAINEGTEYIRPAYVSKRLISKEAGKGDFSFALDAVTDTASDIGSFIVGFSRIGLVVSIAFFLFIGWMYFQAFKKGSK